MNSGSFNSFLFFVFNNELCSKMEQGWGNYIKITQMGKSIKIILQNTFDTPSPLYQIDLKD